MANDRGNIYGTNPAVAAIENFGRTTGEYWAEDNARFEKTDPNFGDRVWRGLNPITGLGSALGQVHSGMSNGDFLGAAFGGLQSIPGFAMTKMRYTMTPIVRTKGIEGDVISGGQAGMRKVSDWWGTGKDQLTRANSDAIQDMIPTEDIMSSFR